MSKAKGMMFLTLVIMLMGFSCSGSESDQPLPTAEVLEDLPAPVEWRFDEPQPDWKPVKPISAQWKAVKPVRVEDALRLPLTARNRADGRRLIGAIYVELPDWDLEDWGYVDIRARTRDRMRRIELDFNYTEEDPAEEDMSFYAYGDFALLVTDGTVQTYRLWLDRPWMRSWEGPWTHLGISFVSREGEEAATLDILSVRVVPNYVKAHYDKAEYMIPMRDGVKIYTQVYTPKDKSQKYPFMLSKTPYTSGRPSPPDFRSGLGPMPHEKFGACSGNCCY